MVPLDIRVRRAAEHWQLTVGDALAGGTSSAVFAARDLSGRDLVLKLPPARPGAEDLTAAEAAALRIWESSGASVVLVDATPDALLLKRARPGRAWPWSRAAALDDAVSVAADLLARIWTRPPASYRFPALLDTYPEDERIARADVAHERRARAEPDRGAPGLRRLPAARTAVQQLIVTCRQQCLLHGDFVTKNLVSDATSATGTVALDPRPMLGDPAADVASFAAYHPVESILPLAESLARAVRLDIGRVMRWTAVWTVHQATQAWRDDQAHLEQLVGSTVVDDLLVT